MNDSSLNDEKPIYGRIFWKNSLFIQKIYSPPNIYTTKTKKKRQTEEEEKKPQKIEKNQIGAILLYEKINQLLLLL